MKLSMQINGSEVTVSISDESKIYILNNDEIFNQIDALIHSEPKQINIDLRTIQFIDSTAFNTLLKLHKSAESQNKRLVIKNVNPEVLRLFKLLRLTEILNIQPAKGGKVISAA